MYADNMIIRSCYSHSLGGLIQKQDFSNITTTQGALEFRRTSEKSDLLTYFCS